ncbi:MULTISPECIES: hypothetical protein [Micromonospora]|uniref:Uncharacterized protein n=1 Tax=Micromonospora solifontis TaxID=2487138 RepID=A0ABX9WMK0_9ACTN|nr:MULTISPECIES: hypothetical protein [Micromonospora]NES13678.1 hypothetical protein [Micromonospora sp. PPF5-17B]NES35487.1 hypothetical protein [Micromonospora solifontis]NES55356.1 hypothetical protein [Micromonospora sp. PPF5-6]RNM00736.1 hypothetical protein EFE23_04830 [Micromonospora solifontis]
MHDSTARSVIRRGRSAGSDAGRSRSARIVRDEPAGRLLVLVELGLDEFDDPTGAVVGVVPEHGVGEFGEVLRVEQQVPPSDERTESGNRPEHLLLIRLTHRGLQARRPLPHSSPPGFDNLHYVK